MLDKTNPQKQNSQATGISVPLFVSYLVCVYLYIFSCIKIYTLVKILFVIAKYQR